MVVVYVDAPEFFDGVKSDNFLEEIVPIVALCVSRQPRLCSSRMPFSTV